MDNVPSNNVPRETKKKEPVQDVVLKERESYLQNYFGTTVNAQADGRSAVLQPLSSQAVQACFYFSNQARFCRVQIKTSLNRL
jgi:hypothetical protein